MTNGERRFLIDGTMARGGGGFTYLVNVVPRLAEAAANDRFRVLVRSADLARAIPPRANLEVECLPEVGLMERLRYVFFEAPRMARRWKADLYYSAGEYVPLTAPCPVVASFQNANVFTRLRQGWPLYQRFRLRLLRALARLSARRCASILFVSQDSCGWMGDAIGLPQSKRAWLHHGIDAARWHEAAPVNPGGRPYILSVSSIYRYKNFVRLIEAWAMLARRRPDLPDLVIVGDDQDPEYSARMEAARMATGPLADRIHIVGSVPYAQVQQYYAGASLFVFPSYLETFGIPMVEAMAAGLPVVASDLPVFREIAQDAAFYADPFDAASIASAMNAVLDSPLAAETLRKRGRERVRDFSWEAAATRLLGLFAEVLGGKRGTVADPTPSVSPGAAWPPAALPWAARSASAPFTARPSAVQQPARF